MVYSRLMQLARWVSFGVLLGAPVTGAWAAGCAAPLRVPLREVQAMIDSLRADAGFENRMIALNGKSYTRAEANWMQEQLNMIDEACRHGREVEATWRVEALQSKLGAGETRGALLSRK